MDDATEGATFRADDVWLRRDAVALGYDDAAIARRVRAGAWHRLRHGAYCSGELWTSLDDIGRHLVLAQAVVRTTPGAVALSHTTALAAHGVAVWGADLRRVHVTRLDGGTPRSLRDAVHHVVTPDADDVVDIDGLLSVSPAVALVGAAGTMSVVPAIVSADNALFQGKCQPDELRRLLESAGGRPHSRRLRVVLKHMDGRSASVGESRSRCLFWWEGLPIPELQHEVRDADGELVGVTDFMWEAQRVLGEFDGKAKYTRYLRPGETPGDAVFREKRREDRIRELTGFSFARLTWSDLDRPRETAQRFASLLGVRLSPLPRYLGHQA